MFPQIFGKYVLERELGSGGMARVFLATLRGAGGFEKRLVVKQIRPELASDQSFVQRFVAEAKTTVELSHANIVPVYELGAENGIYYIAMEFCSGVSLAELLQTGAASAEAGAYIGVEICRALDYAHRKAGVVHRDVTPRNVMIDPEGMVRLIDFGIAAASADGSNGPAFGSPGHMPPEQLGPGPLTPAADVFAVAVLLVEAWTGRPPFRRESLLASARALAEARPALSLANARLAPLDALVDAALALSASERPQSAEEFARPLREFLRGDDLGDIARGLGRRVIERMHELDAHAAQEAAVSQPSRPSHPAQRAEGASATQTFAARGALLEWTAKIESTPLAPSAGTRRGSEVESGLTASTPSQAPRSTRSEKRRRALRVAFGAGVLSLASLGGWLDARVSSSPGSLRTGVSLQRDPTAEVDEGELRTAGAGARELGAIALGTRLDTADPPSSPRTSPSRPAEPEQRTPEHTEPSRLAKRRAEGPLGAGGTEPPPDEVARAAPRSSSALPSVARLQLTADPAAWVEVDAVRVGATPLMAHGVSPGRHTVVFVNQLLGERLEARVSADARQPTRVHADFSSANPRVYVR